MRPGYRLVSSGGYFWLAVQIGEELFLITRKGRVGDCLPP